MKSHLGILFAALLMFCTSAAAQTDPPPVAGETKTEAPAIVEPETVSATIPAPAPVAPQPLVKDLLGVTLGMTAGQVRDKLGKPDNADATGMVFTPDEGSVQVGLDENQTVRSIAVIYTDATKAPSFSDVIGGEAGAHDGDVYELIRYPDAGYWVSYSKTNSASSPLVVVMMRRL